MSIVWKSLVQFKFKIPLHTKNISKESKVHTYLQLTRITEYNRWRKWQILQQECILQSSSASKCILQKASIISSHAHLVTPSTNFLFARRDEGYLMCSTNPSRFFHELFWNYISDSTFQCASPLFGRTSAIGLNPKNFPSDSLSIYRSFRSSKCRIKWTTTSQLTGLLGCTLAKYSLTFFTVQPRSHSMWISLNLWLGVLTTRVTADSMFIFCLLLP